MYLGSSDSAHNIEKCTNKFLDPKNPMIDTNNIEIGQQKELEVLSNYFQFWPNVHYCLDSINRLGRILDNKRR